LALSESGDITWWMSASWGDATADAAPADDVAIDPQRKRTPCGMPEAIDKRKKGQRRRWPRSPFSGGDLMPCRRSGQEAALDAEEDAHDILVVDGGNGRPDEPGLWIELIRAGVAGRSRLCLPS